MIKRYGVDNPSKLETFKSLHSVTYKGRKFPRDDIWQQNIVDSKRKNGTLKHSRKTKEKLSSMFSGKIILFI